MSLLPKKVEYPFNVSVVIEVAQPTPLDGSRVPRFITVEPRFEREILNYKVNTHSWIGRCYLMLINCI